MVWGIIYIQKGNAIWDEAEDHQAEAAQASTEAAQAEHITAVSTLDAAEVALVVQTVRQAAVSDVGRGRDVLSVAALMDNRLSPDLPHHGITVIITDPSIIVARWGAARF